MSHERGNPDTDVSRSLHDPAASATRPAVARRLTHASSFFHIALRSQDFGFVGIVPNCSPAGLTRCAAKRRKFAASGGGNARERANLKAPKVSSRHPPGSRCFGTMPVRLDTFQPPWVHRSGVWDSDLDGRAGSGGCRRYALHPDCQGAHSLNVSIRHTGSLLRTGGRVLGNSPSSVAFLSPRAPLLGIHWPLATILSLPPHQRGQVVRRLFPAGYCHLPTTELAKTERGPISTSGASIFSMSLIFSMLPNQAIPSDKSIPFSPLATARPLTIRLWPEALNARGSGRARRMAIGRSACALVFSQENTVHGRTDRIPGV